MNNRRNVHHKKVYVPKKAVVKKCDDVTPKVLPDSAIMEAHTIWVAYVPYYVILPSGYNVYDGIRLWYPSLYEMIIQDVQYDDAEREAEDCEIEAAWDKADYLEWLYD